MDAEAARYIAKGLMSIGMIAPAIGEGLLFSAAITGMARNPEVAGTLFSRAIIGAAVVESTAIYSLVMFFLI